MVVDLASWGRSWFLGSILVLVCETGCCGKKRLRKRDTRTVYGQPGRRHGKIKNGPFTQPALGVLGIPRGGRLFMRFSRSTTLCRVAPNPVPGSKRGLPAKPRGVAPSLPGRWEIEVGDTKAGDQSRCWKMKTNRPQQQHTPPRSEPLHTPQPTPSLTMVCVVIGGGTARSLGRASETTNCKLGGRSEVDEKRRRSSKFWNYVSPPKEEIPPRPKSLQTARTPAWVVPVRGAEGR